MGRPILTPRQSKGVALTGLLVAALMAADVAYQTGVHAYWRHWLPETLATTRPSNESPETQPAEADKVKPPGKPAEVPEAIKKRNVFSKAKGKPDKPRLTGVIGRVALFQTGGKTVGVEEGKSEQGIKVISIKGYEVTVEFAGQTETMRLFAGTDDSNRDGRQEERGPARRAGPVRGR